MLWLAAAVLLARPQSEASVDLLITRATVVDVRTGSLRRDHDVGIRDGRIEFVRVHRARRAAKRTVDAEGRYLIPGLWDAHVHWYDEASLPLFIANGVTGARVMFGSPMHLDWRRRVEQGRLIAPRMVVAGPIVDGPRPFWPGSLTAANPEQGREAVRKVRAAGYDFVKVYSLLDTPTLDAIADETRKAAIPFAGHVPYATSPSHGSDLGMRSMEHLYNLAIGASRESEAIFAEMGRLPATPATFQDRRFGALSERARTTYDAAVEARLFDRLRRNRTTIVPTLTVLRSLSGLADAKDARFRYFPRGIRTVWERSGPSRKADPIRFERSMRLVSRLNRAGVPIAAGTDCLNDYVMPGFSLHDELDLLHQAGLTPLQTLQAATLRVGEMLQRPEIGEIRPGALADLVLLDGDPLVSVANVRRVRSVVQGGRWFGERDLAALLSRARFRAMTATAEGAEGAAAALPCHHHH